MNRSGVDGGWEEKNENGEREEEDGGWAGARKKAGRSE